MARRALPPIGTGRMHPVGDGAKTSALRALSPGDRQAYPWRRGNVRRRTRALPNAGRICRIRARDHPGTDTCRACQGAREGHQKRQADRSGEDRRSERGCDPRSAGERQRDPSKQPASAGTVTSVCSGSKLRWSEAITRRDGSGRPRLRRRGGLSMRNLRPERQSTPRPQLLRE